MPDASQYTTKITAKYLALKTLCGGISNQEEIWLPPRIIYVCELIWSTGQDELRWCKRKNRKRDRILKSDEKVWIQRARHWNQTFKPKFSRRMHTRTMTEMVSHYIQDVLPQSPVELWDILCSQDHANHGAICSRPTGKDDVGGTYWWNTRHISIPLFWFLRSSMVQRRCRTWRNQTREITWSLPSHRISYDLLGFASKRNTNVQNNHTTCHKFGITNRTMKETFWDVRQSHCRQIQ